MPHGLSRNPNPALSAPQPTTWPKEGRVSPVAHKVWLHRGHPWAGSVGWSCVPPARRAGPGAPRVPTSFSGMSLSPLFSLCLSQDSPHPNIQPSVFLPLLLAEDRAMFPRVSSGVHKIGFGAKRLFIHYKLVILTI